MRRNAAQRLDLLRELLAKEFKVRYKNTVFGFLWSLANPVVYALVFYVAFKIFLRFPKENYLVFLLVALFPWQWFAGTVGLAPSVFIANASLVKKVYFPRVFLPLAILGNNLIHFLLALLVSIPLLAIYGYYPTTSWIVGIPLLLLLQGAVTFGLTMMIASANVYFRDLEQLTMIFLQLLFWVTPIIYPEEAIPPAYRAYFSANPMYPIIASWRAVILDGTINWHQMGIGAAVAAVVALLGYAVYRKMEWRLAESV